MSLCGPRVGFVRQRPAFPEHFFYFELLFVPVGFILLFTAVAAALGRHGSTQSTRSNSEEGNPVAGCHTKRPCCSLNAETTSSRRPDMTGSISDRVVSGWDGASCVCLCVFTLADVLVCGGPPKERPGNYIPAVPGCFRTCAPNPRGAMTTVLQGCIAAES